MSDLLTVPEFAAILRVEGSCVRRWIRRGLLEAIILPHTSVRQGYRIKRETLEQVLATGISKEEK